MIDAARIVFLTSKLARQSAFPQIFLGFLSKNPGYYVVAFQFHIYWSLFSVINWLFRFLDIAAIYV